MVPQTGYGLARSVHWRTSPCTLVAMSVGLHDPHTYNFDIHLGFSLDRSHEVYRAVAELWCHGSWGGKELVEVTMTATAETTSVDGVVTK